MSRVDSSIGRGSSFRDGSLVGRSGPEGAGGGRSALISGLVAQLKRGDITKSELFSRLQQLQGPGVAVASTSTASATGSAISVSVAACASTSSAAPMTSHSAGNSAMQMGQHFSEASPPTTASSAQSSAKAAGAAAAEAAGFFSALDRQAIIQKIADERRRRVEEVRRSLPPTEQASARRGSSNVHLPPQASSSVDLSASNAQTASVELDSSAASQASLQHHQERNLNAPPIPGDTGGARGVALGGSGAALRPTAWEQRQGERPQQSASETSPSSTFDTSTDEFPFPGSRDPQRHKSLIEVGADRRDVPGVEAGCGDDGIDAPVFSNPPSTSRCATAAPSSSAFVGDTAIENSKRSCRGSTRTSKNNDNRAARAISRHASNGRTSNNSGLSDEPSSPGWSQHVRHPSGSGGGGMSGRGTFGVGLGGSGSGSAREPSTSCAESWTNGDGDKASSQDPSRGGRPAAALPRKGAHVVTGQTRRSESRAVGRGGWMGGSDASDANGGSREEVGQRQLQQRGDRQGGSRVGPGGDRGGQPPQAREKMVDEDAYRFRSFSEERARRGEELVRRELMSECTFRPKIKGLPQSYGATNHDDTPFLQRVNQWQRDKEKYADARKADGQDKELEECTFTPRVNSVSRRAARSRRQALGENHLAVDDRLYDESVRRELERSHLAAEQAAREEERLHEECTFRPDLLTKRAAEAAAAAAAAAAGDGDDENEIDWGHSVPRGRSRYRQAAAAVAAAVATGGGGGSTVWGAGRRANGINGGGGGGGCGTGHWELESCTFTPSIIGARKGMSQAQQYLQYDVVDRLTGAAFRPPDDNDYNDTGSEEGEELFQEGGGTLRARHRQGFGFGVTGVRGRPGVAEGRGICSPAWGTGGNDGEKGGFEESIGTGLREQGEQSPRRQGTGGAASDTSSSFHAFLSRQNKMETDKLKHIEQIQAMRQNTFRPEICAESKKIHMESNKGDFLQRVARDAARKEHEAVRQKAAGLHDPACTFKPQITARSATLQPRSVVELSRGDQLKRETTQRLTRLRAEQELLADTTFRPRINADAASRMAVSKLKVVSDPDSYIANVETIRRRKEQTVVRGAIEKAAKEVEGCTFKPVTTECPAYIKRIAQSISASKALSGSGGGMGKKEQPRAKPDWK